MEYEKLKDKVKKMGFRVTKDVKGKRVKLTKNELKSKLPVRAIPVPTLENQAKSAKKFIRVCKMVLREAEPKIPRTRQQTIRMSPKRLVPLAPIIPQAPPPPPRPVGLNPRAQLMANLKADLKKRGLANNNN
jgi:hypothetical protein